MKFIDLQQRTPEWLVWRNQGITATEIAVVMGKSPYKSPWRLWCEKVGKALPPNLDNNPLVKYGQEHEDQARQLFELTHGEVLLSACAEADVDPLFRASFDGLTSANEPVEIKCPSRTTLEKVRRLGKDSDTVRLYMYQLQFQMMVSGAPKGWLVFFDEDSQSLLEFEAVRDDALCSEMLVAGRGFWNNFVVPKKEPAKDPVRDIYVPKTEEDIAKWCGLSADFASAQAEVEALQARINAANVVRERCKAELSAMMGSFRYADFAGVALTKRLTKGSIDYKKVLKAKALSVDDSELEAYRKAGTESWLIRLTDSPMPQDFIDPELEEALASNQASEPMWF